MLTTRRRDCIFNKNRTSFTPSCFSYCINLFISPLHHPCWLWPYVVRMVFLASLWVLRLWTRHRLVLVQMSSFCFRRRWSLHTLAKQYWSALNTYRSPGLCTCVNGKAIPLTKHSNVRPQHWNMEPSTYCARHYTVLFVF